VAILSPAISARASHAVRSTPRTWLALLAVAGLYVATGKLGLRFASVNASATPVWPPTGIALAALILLGWRAWPAVFAGAFVVNVTTAGSWATALGIALGNTVEAVAGVWLVERFAGGGRHVFERVRGVFAFAALGGFVPALAAATIGVTTLTLAGYASWSAYGSIWLTWWLGDAGGALIVAPLILLWAGGPPREHVRVHRGEALAVLGAVALTSYVVFGGGLPAGLRDRPVAFLCLPVLLWPALRFGRREAATMTALVAVLAVMGTLRGFGPFALGERNPSLLVLQAFLATLATTVLAVAALVGERRRAEDEMRQSEGRLRLAIQAGGMGIWEWTVATGEVRWSPGLEAIHGMPAGSFPGTFAAFQADIHPDDRDRVREEIAAALARGEHRVEYRIVRPDGAVRWVEGRGEVFRDAAGRPERLLGVCTDVTARRSADEERRTMERRLAFLGEIARSITASLDLDIVLQRIVDGSRLLGGSDTAAIFLRDGDSDVMVPRYRVGPWIPAYDGLRIRPGVGLGGEVMLTGRPVRTARYVPDAQSPAGIGAVLAKTGTVALMVVPIVIDTHVDGLLYISNRTPREFTDEDEAVCVRLGEQAAIAIQNARLFARQEAARDEAEAANRAKDEFLAMLGHELRNPVGAISNATHVLGRADAADVQRHAREIIERQIRHLGRLVDDLLDVSRLMMGKIMLHPAPHDVAEIVRRALAGLESAAPAPRAPVVVRTTPAWALVDAVRIEQVVTNLLANALKYTPAGGTIHVSVAQEGGEAVFRVHDSGIGIAPELLPRVFDLFVQGTGTLDRAQGGLGIGLTLVRRLVELHGGSVHAASDGRDRGSTFTVRLPLASARPDDDGAAPVAPAARARRVLIVEDNDDSRAMLRELVALLGHEVDEAADGPSAVELALRLRPDVMLVDVGLPGIDGYEVARRIRAADGAGRIRLVALTGYGLPEDRARALEAGYEVHLTKPIDPATLQRILEADDPA
jgi:PAS domain S-box-containing protein